MDESELQRYLDILKEELLPATGCTEPIAVAYASAIAKRALGGIPERAEIGVSGNILKNVKSVIVPNTGGCKGIAAAVCAGLLCDPYKKLELLTAFSDADRAALQNLLANVPVHVEKAASGCVFDIGVRLFLREDTAFVRIEGKHTNVVTVEKNGHTMYEGALVEEGVPRQPLDVKSIVEFADMVSANSLEPLIGIQISCNRAICEEGLRGDWGARIGKVLLSAYGESVHNRAKAYPAAGSDARMNGCSLPVVILSGSGNQGITAAMPPLVYAEQMGAPRELLLRAVALSDLITLRLKSVIGRLSAYCGAVSAGIGAGAGVCYLHGGRYDDIAHTVVNGLAIASGIVCDGAKSSCAAKIASAVDAGLLGFEMYRSGSQFYGGEGILEQGVEKTIDNIGLLARNGMRSTDEEIIRLMIGTLPHED